jgi:hypothetical protein
MILFTLFHWLVHLANVGKASYPLKLENPESLAGNWAVSGGIAFSFMAGAIGVYVWAFSRGFKKGRSFEASARGVERSGD